MSTLPENKALIRRYLDEIWNQGHLASLHTFIAPHATLHVPPFPDGVGVDAFAAMISSLRAALPDLSIQPDILFGAGDRVMQRFALTGTHTGADLFGFRQQGRAISTSGVNIFQLDQSRIVCCQGLIDMPSVMQQLQSSD